MKPYIRLYESLHLITLCAPPSEGSPPGSGRHKRRARTWATAPRTFFKGSLKVFLLKGSYKGSRRVLGFISFGDVKSVNPIPSIRV